VLGENFPAARIDTFCALKTAIKCWAVLSLASLLQVSSLLAPYFFELWQRDIGSAMYLAALLIHSGFNTAYPT